MVTHLIQLDDATFSELKRIVKETKMQNPKFRNLITNNFVISKYLATMKTEKIVLGLKE